MGEIRMDDKRIQEAFIDGSEVQEVWIDGCVIRFDKLYRSGFYLVEGGSASPTIDGTDWKEILYAGIRWKGAPHIYGTGWTPWGSSSSIGNNSCSNAGIPSIPSAPFGRQHGGYTGTYQGRVSGSRVHDAYYTGTASLIIGGSTVASGTSVWGLFPSVTSVIGTTTGTGTPVRGCVQSNNSSYSVVGAVRARAQHHVTAYSAGNPATVLSPGGISGDYTFWLSNGSLSPSGSGPNAMRISDIYNGPEPNLDDWFYQIPFPWAALNSEEMNTFNITNVIGSQRVFVEIFVVYR